MLWPEEIFLLPVPHPQALRFLPLPPRFPMDSFLIRFPIKWALIIHCTPGYALLLPGLITSSQSSHNNPCVEEEEMGVSDWLEKFQEIGPVFLKNPTSLKDMRSAETSSQVTGRRKGRETGKPAHFETSPKSFKMSTSLVRAIYQVFSRSANWVNWQPYVACVYEYNLAFPACLHPFTDLPNTCLALLCASHWDHGSEEERQ